VLADRLPPPRAEVGKQATAGEVVLAYLAEQADAIQAADPQVRRGAPDSVHAMRVACRRMRSTMRSFRTVLDRDRTYSLVAELRWLAGQLGGARDFEVQEQRIGAAVDALPPELSMGPVAAEVTRFFARRRPDAGRTAEKALDSDRYLALLDAIDALLVYPPLTPAAEAPAHDLLPAAPRQDGEADPPRAFRSGRPTVGTRAGRAPARDAQAPGLISRAWGMSRSENGKSVWALLPLPYQ